MFALPPEIERYDVTKGSVALDGALLTVADRDADPLDAAITPTTYELTSLSAAAPGDPVHVEADVVAKYVESMLDGYLDGIGDRLATR
jgi:riboflavin synthase